MADAPLYHFKISMAGFDSLVTDLSKGLFAIHDLGREFDKYIEIMRTQAVANVSGSQVSWSGGVFVVNRVTGKLAQSMQVEHINPLAAYLVNTAKYAGAVHDGHGQIDMKKYLAFGTIVPIRGDKGTLTAKKIAKKDAKGRVRGYDYITFRRVGKTGWIIPPAKGRPFFTAAVEKWEPELTKAIAAVVAKYIEGNKP